MNIFQNIKRFISYLLFPERCLSCGSPNTTLCHHCKKYLQEKFNPVVVKTQNKELSCVSCFVYEGTIRNIIHSFKFQNQKSASTILSEFLTIAIQNELKSKKFDIITFVPNYKCLSYTREYNQSEILSEEISNRLGIPIKKCLTKIKKNRKQHKLSFSERQENVKGVYSSTEDLKNKTILLCDDIITTGATLSECVKELKKSGANVICATVAHTVLKDQE